MFDKNKLISELERYIDFIHKTRLTQKDGISASGHPHEEFIKYPPGTPGIHEYWDSEMWQLQDADEVLNWFKYGKNTSDKYVHLFQGRNLKFRLNYMNYLFLNPSYNTLYIAECGRGMEILLALAVKNTWNKIFCTDIVPAFGKILKDFFNDERIVFYNIKNENFDLNNLQDDTIAILSPGGYGEESERLYRHPNVKMLILNGIKVSSGLNSVLDHRQSLENIDIVYDELKNNVGLFNG
jgi:hypothetical protein